ncbi:hypothetical protein VOLCADRAFT_88693 [Volvox carteri f. nagariensis]|uniref:CobW C-terminal domain-containing protein n=1 Tax=Volvox carteri f. nagariensis TaxID=3068 RepID=D8TPP8_VOLCA|nr:uncharacterized protein VOLCADRAFT_88693 [Volvox carteri f. nagariensis]EFJ50805.1 hypothetical protein VOLCADRAFT_88693 [Volvox carteri f. nagariensis]|eukprot:XP_002948398.1 hypothetical protein VOLCADRAFT_88693 [Volvox carteri f. nagariensis]
MNSTMKMSEPPAVEQLAFADKVLLNKADLVSAEEKQEVVKRIKAINSSADIIETVQGNAPLERILEIKAFSLERILEGEPTFLESDGEHQHDSSVTSVGLELEGEMDKKKLDSWLGAILREKGTDIFRSKGILAIKGTADKLVFQGVHMLMGFASSSEGVGKPWRDGEKRVNRIVFIGRHLDRKQLASSFTACLAD